MKEEDKEYIKLRINPASYSKYMKEFGKGNYSIDAAYRAMHVGVELSQKLRENFNTMNRAAWRKKWAPHMDATEIAALETAFEQDKPNVDIEAILLPHVSVKDLANADEEVLFDAWQDLLQAFKKKTAFQAFFDAADTTSRKSVLYMDEDWEPLGD